MARVRWFAPLAIVLLTEWTQAEQYRFVDIHGAAGVDAVIWFGRPDKPHLLESGGSGAALFDYDGDGALDLYLVNGWRLADDRVVEKGSNRLYRNRGDGNFEDVTVAAGVGDEGWGTAVTAGDVDGDGDLDLFVANFGPDVLFMNGGNGTFSRAPAPPGIDGWSSSSAFFDADGDGDLDLFVTGYIDASLQEVLTARPTLAWKERLVMKGPFGLEGLGNRFFRNDGAGAFTEATETAGLVDVGLFYSFGVMATDLDGNGTVDVYVANDSNPNYVYRNEGDGRFAEMGLWSGAALDNNGNAQAGMGIATTDYDNDGLLDMLVTHFADDASTLYRNLGGLMFEDVTQRTGIRTATFKPLSWGTVFADFDLDGDAELFIANGHIYPQADAPPATGTSFRQANQLLEYTGDRFVDVTGESGEGLAIEESSRGVASGDIDGDGDLDLVVVNVDAPPTVLRNDTSRRGNYLLVDAPGALRVEVVAGAFARGQQRVAGGSYASYSDARFHLGVGPRERLDSVTVYWPGERTKTLSGVGTNQVLRVDAPE